MLGRAGYESGGGHSKGLQKTSMPADVHRLDIMVLCTFPTRRKRYILNQRTMIAFIFLFGGRDSGQEPGSRGATEARALINGLRGTWCAR